jgi:HK97 family phage prohead protease
MPYVPLDEFKQRFKKGEDTNDCIIRKQFTLEKIEKMEETEEGVKIDFVISTSSVDRDQDTIAVDGWSLENYRKNPVVLWAHDGQQPAVAKSLSEWIQDQKLKSTALFTPKDLFPFGHMIGQMYLKGFLNAVSVGFRSTEAKWAVDQNTRPWGIDYFKQELLEYSCCPVPANPEALVDAKSAGIDLNPMLEWAIKILDNSKEIIDKSQANAVWNIIKPKHFIIDLEGKNITFLTQEKTKESNTTLEENPQKNERVFDLPDLEEFKAIKLSKNQRRTTQ